jgi:hypothetical protein
MNIKDKAVKFEAHNPLLLWNGVNTIFKQDLNGIPEFSEFLTKFEAAKKQAKQEDICYGLTTTFSDENKGFGGFYSAGFIPDISIFGGDCKEDFNKKFKYYWPKDPFSGKYMQYLGSICLNLWPYILDALTSRKVDDYWIRSFACGVNDVRWFDKNNKYWLHFWASEQNEFDSPIPDCHVRMTVKNYSEFHLKFDLERRVHSDEEWNNFFKEWQETQCVKSSVKGENSFFNELNLRFYWDGLGKLSDRKAESENGIFNWDRGDIKVYGNPASQQEPRRYISPNGYCGVRGCVPILSFNDGEADMTHQFYCDVPLMDNISHTRAYCKLDSSCT